MEGKKNYFEEQKKLQEGKERKETTKLAVSMIQTGVGVGLSCVAKHLGAETAEAVFLGTGAFYGCKTIYHAIKGTYHGLKAKQADNMGKAVAEYDQQQAAI